MALKRAKNFFLKFKWLFLVLFVGLAVIGVGIFFVNKYVLADAVVFTAPRYGPILYSKSTTQILIKWDESCNDTEYCTPVRDHYVDPDLWGVIWPKHYNIYRNDNLITPDWQLAGSTNVRFQVQYLDKNLTPGTTYQYKVVAVDDDEVEAVEMSDPLEVTTLATLDNHDYYMSPTGSDSNDGLSIGNAFKTINHFGDIAGPGDTLWLVDGTYNNNNVGIDSTISNTTWSTPYSVLGHVEDCHVEDKGTPDLYCHGLSGLAYQVTDAPDNNWGTEDAPITIKAINNKQAIIDVKYLYEEVKSDYVIFDGLAFRGFGTGFKNTYMIQIFGRHVTIQNCLFRYDMTTQAPGDWLKINHTDYVEIKNNEFTGTNNHGENEIDSVGGRFLDIHNNYFHDFISDYVAKGDACDKTATSECTGQTMLFKGGGYNVFVHDNIFYNNGTPGQISYKDIAFTIGGSSLADRINHQAYGAELYEIARSAAYNNLIYNPPDPAGGGQGGIGFFGAVDSIGFNNTIVNNAVPAFEIVDGTSDVYLHSKNVTLANNIVSTSSDLYYGVLLWASTGNLEDFQALNNIWYRPAPANQDWVSWDIPTMPFTYAGKITHPAFVIASGTGDTDQLVDPVFLNPTGEEDYDLHFDVGSPAIDTGADVSAFAASIGLTMPTTDLDDNTRIIGDDIDAGVYEYDPLNGPNYPPVLDPIGAQSIDEGSELSFVVSATDPNVGDILTYSATNLPHNADFNPDTQTFTWTPSFSQADTYENVHFAVEDDELASDSEDITITVNDVPPSLSVLGFISILPNGENNPPVLDPIGPQSTDENVELSFVVSATDPDPGETATLVYSATNLPDGADFDPDTHTFTWTPSYDQAGMFDNVHFEVEDVHSATDSENISITVDNTNRPPVLAAIGAKSVNENVLLSFTIAATDPDTGETAALVYSASNLPGGSHFDPDTHIFTWTPDYDQAGTYPAVHFEVEDVFAATDSENITITVHNINRTPTLAAIGAKAINEGVELSFVIAATDPDTGETATLVYSVTNLPSGAHFDSGTHTFTWTPTFSQSGTYPNVHFKAQDIHAANDTEDITITVNDIGNDPPILAHIGSKSVIADEELSFLISATDPDAGETATLVYSASNLPDGANFDVSAHTFSWTPTTAQVGAYAAVHFEVEDINITTDSENITITVNAPDSSEEQAPTSEDNTLDNQENISDETNQQITDNEQENEKSKTVKEKAQELTQTLADTGKSPIAKIILIFAGSIVLLGLLFFLLRRLLTK